MVEAGATGIITKRGRYGGTFCSMDWTLHFANWLDAAFYVETIDAFRQLSDIFYGKEFLYQRFSREIAAKNYGLITRSNRAIDIPRLPNPETSGYQPGMGDDKQLHRLISQIDADIINLAVWDMTALQWRSKFPQKDSRKNMRDYATSEELQVVSALQIIMRELQDNQYTPEEKLHHLRNRATDLLEFYCNKPKSQLNLEKAREKRGW